MLAGSKAISKDAPKGETDWTASFAEPEPYLALAEK